MDICKYVDVFHGCGEISLPEPDGIAASWHFVKAISGNTVPAATLPFGKYSCCMYTKGYPTGYGENEGNYSPDRLPKMRSGAKYFGLSHFHQSGTGAIDYYYNYALTTAFYGIAPCNDGQNIVCENAQPGYYSVKTADGTLNEATVNESCVFHRFSFERDCGKISVDFTNNGLYKYDAKYFRPDNGLLRIIGENKVYAKISHNGLVQHFVYTAGGAKIRGITYNNVLIDEKEICFGHSEDIYAVLFDVDGKKAECKLAVSLVSYEHAEKLLDTDDDFDTAEKAAYDKWNNTLSAIEIETDDERQKKIFYSNLYHSLVKPSDRSGESPYGNTDGFFTDISTMWDIYKTQLPLVFTLYPDISRKIMACFLAFAENTGCLPHMVALKKDFLEPSSQACMLAEHSVCDAYYRGVEADYNGLFDAAVKDMNRTDYAYLYSDKLPERLTHLVDASEAASDICALAQRLSKAVPENIKKLSLRQRDCYDEKTGLLKSDFDYYEGNVWNYSFRLMCNMNDRIAFAGGKEEFIKLLDRFFGYTEPKSLSTRFEGFNNEPDIETPFAYSYAGRIDRVCEIADAMRKYMFTDGRGGIPGNNDSGGLSSCYVWNCLGIFPVTGQDLMLIGSPAFSKAVVHLANGKTLTIIKNGSGIYTNKAVLNGRVLEDFSFTASEMMNGGELIIN